MSQENSEVPVLPKNENYLKTSKYSCWNLKLKFKKVNHSSVEKKVNSAINFFFLVYLRTMRVINKKKFPMNWEYPICFLRYNSKGLR